MQNYMISERKRNGVSPSETVEDRAAKDFRTMVRAKGGRQRHRRQGSLMYAVSASLVLVLIVMGVSMVNNFDKMRSVQTTLDNLASGTPGTDTVETQETSGTVTAVTSEEQAGDSEASAADTKQDSGEGTGAEEEDQDVSGESDNTSSEENAESQAAENENAENDAAAVSSDTNGSNGIYIVEKGDTLAIISRKMYGDLTHVDAICRMNGITDGNLIYVGQKLLLP